MLTINNTVQVIWYGHSSIQLVFNSKSLFIDPYNINTGKADYILITHYHPSHFSRDDIDRLRKENTIIITPLNCPDEIQGSVISMKPNSYVTLHDIKITAIPAYNLGGKPYHPKSNNWLGYIVEMKNTRIYHSGDTDVIPEMKNLRNIDLAFLPVSGRSVMNPGNAAEAASNFKPKLVVPIHWNNDRSSIQNAAIFKKLYKGNTYLIKPDS